MTVPQPAAGGIDLLARHPDLDPAQLLNSLVPSARFQDTRFSTYQPNPDFPSQEAARQACKPSYIPRRLRRPASGRSRRSCGPLGAAYIWTAVSGSARPTC
ncbi:hypothetical protein [Deinococcus radiophilus]|uniref:hypothetical protein n=1 Tax=Deinococcus radiophilus TaxID=32062 RepID=UPI0036086328